MNGEKPGRVSAQSLGLHNMNRRPAVAGAGQHVVLIHDTGQGDDALELGGWAQPVVPQNGSELASGRVTACNKRRHSESPGLGDAERR